MANEKSKGEVLAQEVSDMLNGFASTEMINFVKQMGREHRTLQQLFTKLCVRWFEHLHDCGERGQYDGRNEASVQLARAIFEKCYEDVHLPLI